MGDCAHLVRPNDQDMYRLSYGPTCWASPQTEPRTCLR